MMHHKPDVRHFTASPLLGILATVDVTLESLIGGLRDQFPEVDDGAPLHATPCDTPNNVRTAIALAQSLQILVARICTNQMEIIDSTDDYIF